MEQRHEPVALILSRQNLLTQDRTKYADARGVERGGYVLADGAGTAEVILIASGSEVALCIEAYERLRTEGVRARVVSMPSWELFERQSPAYRTASCRRRSRPGSRWSRPRPSAGSGSSAPAERRSG